MALFVARLGPRRVSCHIPYVFLIMWQAGGTWVSSKLGGNRALLWAFCRLHVRQAPSGENSPEACLQQFSQKLAQLLSTRCVLLDDSEFGFFQGKLVFFGMMSWEKFHCQQRERDICTSALACVTPTSFAFDIYHRLSLPGLLLQKIYVPRRRSLERLQKVTVKTCRVYAV